MTLSDWFQGFEKGISCLNEEQRASFFSECGKNCVKCGTLQIYQQLYEKTNGDLDTFFSEANKLPGVKSEIIKKDSAYYLHFMECTCMLHRQDMFPHHYFMSVPSKAFFTSYIHYGKTRHFG